MNETKIYTPKDNIDMLLHFLSHTTCKELLKTEPADLRHLLTLLTSPEATDDPNLNFTVLFPDEEIYKYIDEEGRRLHGGRSLKFWNRYGQGGQAATLARQRKWLRDRAIPACRQKLLSMIKGRAVNEALCEEVYPLAFLIPEIERVLCPTTEETVTA